MGRPARSIGSDESVASGLADGFASASVFIVASDVADPFAEPHVERSTPASAATAVVVVVNCPVSMSPAKSAATHDHAPRDATE